MFKILPLLIVAFSACSSITINGTMCDQIATEPNAVMPVECQKYSEEKAEKAFNKTKKKLESKEDVIEFSKDADEKKN
jgi:hypothetical protein